jgi:hypothetical protein
MKNRINKIQNALKQIKPQKVGTIITVLLFGAICAIGGYELRSSTDGASSALPVSKGGTGGNNFPANSVLVGNGPLSFSSRGIDTTPQNGSDNLITSNALYQGSPAEDAPLRMINGWSLTYNSNVKIGRLCNLAFRTNNSSESIPAGTNAHIGYVDDKCKPTQRIYMLITLSNVSNSSHNNVYLMITTTGIVYIYNYSASNIVSGVIFGVSVTYLAA